MFPFFTYICKFHIALCTLHTCSLFFARQPWLTTDFFISPQAVRAFLSVQLDEIWHTSVEGVVIALLTNIIEINVNTVDWKNASRWAWDVRVNFILKLYFFLMISKQICHQIESKNIVVNGHAQRCILPVSFPADLLLC